MIYEYRSYEAAPGKLEDLNRRFKELTCPIFQRLGIEQVGFWIPEDSDRIVYVLRWKDRAESEAAWQVFKADPEWLQGKAASEVNGPLVASTFTEYWSPTAYSSAT